MGAGVSRWAVAAAVLTVAQLGLTVALYQRSTEARTVYVLMPMVDVVPGGNPLDRSEAEALVVDVRRQADARDMQTAFAWLGSTLSLDDLLRGIEALEGLGQPLTGDQKRELARELDAAKANHARIREVQAEALKLEAEIDAEISTMAAVVPGEAGAQLRALTMGRAGAPGPTGGPGPAGGAGPAAPGPAGGRGPAGGAR